MEGIFRQCICSNFLGAIDMLKGIIDLCPNEMWLKDKKFYYMAYHTTIFLDYYMSHPVTDFNPMLPYTILPEKELPLEAIDDVIPNRHYSQEEMIAYLIDIRKKCHQLILNTNDQDLHHKWIKPTEINLHGLCPSIVEEYTVLEIIFYNFRHLQHHVGQLNFMLRNSANVAADWISQAN
jgi:hypothetical protein